MDNFQAMNDVINEMIEDVQAKESALISDYLRTVATPPIKGEITPGKIRWRGISIGVLPNFGGKVIVQRGVAISPIIKVEIPKYDCHN